MNAGLRASQSFSEHAPEMPERFQAGRW